jgi:hypothetical protein
MIKRLSAVKNKTYSTGLNHNVILSNAEDFFITEILFHENVLISVLAYDQRNQQIITDSTA